MDVLLDKEITSKYFKSGMTVALALSGGADSVCLAYLIKELSERRGFGICAMHLNHNIRGAEALRDENFCRGICERLKIEAIIGSEDVPALAKREGLSLEEAARNARYAFFEREMRKRGISVIATAHNADDNAETVFLRLIRGTTLDGICGIPRERTLAEGLTLVRPMLSISKEQILEYCRSAGAEYVTDSTNFCTDYPRNRIRASVIPEAERINPSFLAVSARNCKSFARDSDYLRSEADSVFARACDGGSIRVSEFSDMHPAIMTRVIARFCNENGANVESVHIDAICDAVKCCKDFALSVPKGKRVLSEGGVMRVCDDVRIKKTRNLRTEVYVAVIEGEVRIETEKGVTVSVSVNPAREELPDETEFVRVDGGFSLKARKTLCFDGVCGILTVRNAMPGDTVDFGNFRKDIRKAFGEKKVPVAMRAYMPVISDEKGIIYVPTVGCARRVSGKGNVKCTFDVELSVTEINQ